MTRSPPFSIEIISFVSAAKADESPRNITPQMIDGVLIYLSNLPNISKTTKRRNELECQGRAAGQQKDQDDALKSLVLNAIEEAKADPRAYQHDRRAQQVG